MAIFLAELGDKTQLAAISLTAETKKPLSVFLGASSALVIVTLIGVLFGEVLTKFLGEKLIKVLASLFFILAGFLLLKEAISGS